MQDQEGPDAPPQGAPHDPAAELPFDSTIPVMLLRARETMMRDIRAVLAAEGFTEQQWRVMRTLAARGPLDAAALSERSLILPPSLTRILQALEDRGFLMRSRDEADRRRLVCAITDAGMAQVRALAPRTAAVHGRIEERFGAARTAELKALLKAIADLE